MTEDEARKKWCPEVRVAGGQDWTGSSNSDPQTPRNNNPLYCCIASDCMMWVWEGDYRNGCHSNGAPCTEGDCRLKNK